MAQSRDSFMAPVDGPAGVRPCSNLEMPDPKHPRLQETDSDPVDPLSLYSSELPRKKNPESDSNAIPAASVRSSTEPRRTAAAPTRQGSSGPPSTSFEVRTTGFDTSGRAPGRTAFEWPNRETPAPQFFHAPPRTASKSPAVPGLQQQAVPSAANPVETSVASVEPGDNGSARSPISGPMVNPVVKRVPPPTPVAPRRQAEIAAAQEVAAAAPVSVSRSNRVTRLVAGFALVALLPTATVLLFRAWPEQTRPAEAPVASDNDKEAGPDSNATHLEPASSSGAAKEVALASLPPPAVPPLSVQPNAPSAPLPPSSGAKLQARATPPSAASPRDGLGRRGTPRAKAAAANVASSRSKPESATGPAGKYWGRLQVTTQPPGAQVFIDRQMVGVSPVALPELLAGSHVVRIDLEGYERWSSSVQVVASKGANLNVNLRRADR
ncbi:MAG: hypothetical protein C5B57_10920 [Blastocatellia bacterium]|nr:MAG: hypothetical protein C5B57_10920 [Blastocatellia bacterium]